MYTDIAVRSLTCHTATGTHMPYRITQCYLPPDRGDVPAFTPSRSCYSIKRPRGDARLSWSSWLVVIYEMVYPPEDGHPSKYQPGPTCVNFVRATNSVNHYATPPTMWRTHRQYCCIRTKIAFWAASICRVVRCGLLLSMFRGLCVCLFVTTVKSDRIGWTGWRAVWVADSGRTKEPCVSLGGPRSPGEGTFFGGGISRPSLSVWNILIYFQHYSISGCSDATFGCQSCSNFFH